MGADAVKAYVRLVPLESAARRAAEASQPAAPPAIKSKAAPGKKRSADEDIHKVVALATLENACPADLGEKATELASVMVEKAAGAVPAAWPPTVRLLAAPLEVEIQATAPPPPLAVWIRNPPRRAIRGGYHLSQTPLDGVLPWEARTRCGWRYGLSQRVVVDASPPEPRHFYMVCKRCAPEFREDLFRAFAAETGVLRDKLCV